MNKKSVKMGPDGKYRWAYELNMLTNPTILVEVFKVLGISLAITWVFSMAISLFDGDNLISAARNLASLYAILIGVMLVLGILGYLLYSALSGWKYMVVFEMDENGVEHRQMKQGVEKAKVLAMLSSMAGLGTGNVGAIGRGLLAASHHSLSSAFPDVRLVKAVPRFHLIKVNGLLTKNRIYVDDDNFDFVYDYICQHCPKARKITR